MRWVLLTAALFGSQAWAELLVISCEGVLESSIDSRRERSSEALDIVVDLATGRGELKGYGCATAIADINDSGCKGVVQFLVTDGEISHAVTRKNQEVHADSVLRINRYTGKLTVSETVIAWGPSYRWTTFIRSGQLTCVASKDKKF